jgi:hypothetical protein
LTPSVVAGTPELAVVDWGALLLDVVVVVDGVLLEELVSINALSAGMVMRPVDVCTVLPVDEVLLEVSRISEAAMAVPASAKDVSATNATFRTGAPLPAFVGFVRSVISLPGMVCPERMRSFKNIPAREWHWLIGRKERLTERNDFALFCRFGMRCRPDFRHGVVREEGC